MEQKQKEAVEEYQCPGCVCGSDTSCFEEKSEEYGCKKHCAGTMILGLGSFFLGMPKGFNRLGPRMEHGQLPLQIFESFDKGWGYNQWNVPVWKHVNEKGHTMVRGLSPRINSTFLHLYLEDCSDKIDCLDITSEMEGMD